MRSIDPAQLDTAAFGFGQTRHTRRWPALNTFAVGSVFVRLPMRTMMAQAPQRVCGLFGVNRLSPIGFRDSDHGDRQAAHGSALAWVDRILSDLAIDDAGGQVWLHTFPNVLGYAFKPVSFWFCHSASGALRAVVVEVHNTFGEQHCYVLRHEDGAALRDGETMSATKLFHVSPFFPVRGTYRFRWVLKAHQSIVRIDYHDALHQPAQPDAVTLATSISGEHRTLSVVTCIRALLAYPAQAVTVVARIHWQALKLWGKRVTFYPKPSAPSQAVSTSNTLLNTRG